MSETATSRAIWCCNGFGLLAPVFLQGDVLEAVLHQDFLAVQGDPEVAHGVQADLEGALADDDHGTVQFTGVNANRMANNSNGPYRHPNFVSNPFLNGHQAIAIEKPSVNGIMGSKSCRKCQFFFKFAEE